MRRVPTLANKIAKQLADVGVRVEPPVRLGRVVEGLSSRYGMHFFGVALAT